ncbi:MAG: ubiquinol-cytochrome C reductase [Alphaproteobacteria bacterium]|nr:ubiquinol-cytochrome C reductase [Alphaproteobacteria bacterium]
MLLDRLFRPRAAHATGRALYTQLVEQARRPALYAAFGAPDTVEGRFELYTLHLVLLLERLRGAGGPQAAETAQALFDTYLKGLDDALRELGVGDLVVGKKMRRLGEAFYGRGKSYDAAFAALPDREPLIALLARTVYEGRDASSAPELAGYVAAQREALAAAPLERLLAGEVCWAAA